VADDATHCVDYVEAAGNLTDAAANRRTVSSVSTVSSVAHSLLFMFLGAGLALAAVSVTTRDDVKTTASHDSAALRDGVRMTASQYNAAQLAGFEIFTFPGLKDDDACSQESLFNENSFCYKGVDDVSDDAAMRVRIMLEAIDAAFASKKTNHSSSVLKVFLAPEFFFRGPAGAYLTDDIVTERVDCLNRLYDHVAHPRFEDWLFVFGTVVAASPPHTRFSGFNASAWAFYNFAPVRERRQQCAWLAPLQELCLVD